MARIIADDFVEENRSSVWCKEGNVRLVVEHIFRHSTNLGVHDVWGVAHDEIPLAIVIGRQEGILYLEGNGSPERIGIFTGDVECFQGDIPCRDRRSGQIQGQRDGDAAATRADIQHSGTSPLGGNPAAELLGLRSRDEYTWGHVEAAPTEGGIAQHILHGFAFFQAPDDFSQFCLVICR